MRKSLVSSVRVSLSLAAGVLAMSAGAFADSTTQPSPASEPAFTLPPIIVTAQKREEPLEDVPVSVTAIGRQTIEDAQIQNVNDAAPLVPNLTIQQFSAPRESFPFIRGIGSGQGSPAVTTYIDGVPQLSFSTSNIQLVDIDRMEFLRGPQGTLYGRNTLGGVINIYTQQPTDTTHGDVTVTGGTYALQDYRFGVRGPLEPGKAYYAVAGGYQARDGYTLNRFDDQYLDSVNELFGRVELRFTPTPDWDLRLTLNGERDADGDFPLADLDSLRQTPRRVDHNYQGETHRDVGQFAFNAIYHGQDVDFTSVTAIQYFNSKELTDLDETQFNAATRSNLEQQRNLIEEARFMSPNDRPIVINNDLNLHWVAGALAFATGDEPRVGNHETALASPVAFTNFQDANLDNVGIGVYGQGTLSFLDKLDLTLGGRVDYEYEHANINNTFSPPIAPAFNGSDTKDFTEFSPRVAVDYHWTPQLMTYATVAKGYRAGGFNSTFAAPSQIPFDPERSWSYEVGTKSSLLDNRLTLNADLFYIDWKHLQLDTPIPGEPSAFYISNAGDARSEGLEVEGDYLLFSGLEVFGGLGFDHARFERAIQPSGASAEGNRLPYAPETTWNVGTQYTLPLPHDMRVYARADVYGVGPYSYDASNIAGQGAYVLTNLRVGYGGSWWRVEGWVNNAFNTHYIPLAFPFPGSASGYVGESGDPLTAGVTMGVNF
jgi:iron complex outermembrane receptor protein